MSKVKVTGSNVLLHSILQWILTRLGTYLVLKRIWNPIDFQVHRSKVKVAGSNFQARGCATLCVAVVVGYDFMLKGNLSQPNPE